MLQRVGKWLLVLPGEGRFVVYATLLNLMLGLGMTMGNNSSDAMFFKRFGVEYLPYALFFTSLLLVLFGTLYSEFADRYRPASLSKRLLLILVLLLLLCWLLIRIGGGGYAYLAYYLCFAVASEIVLSHFNFYLTSAMDATQSKRLFPLIGASQRLGGIMGGLGMGLAVQYLALEMLILAWAGTLLVAFLMISRYHRQDARPVRLGRKKHSAPFQSTLDGLRFARSSTFLQITALGVFLLILIVSIQDYLVSTIFTRHFQDERSLAAFLGWFSAFNNAATLLAEVLLTNRLLRRYGLKVVNLIFPLSTVISFALLSISPSLLGAIIGRLNYRGMMRAFRHPTYNLYFQALPSHMQGRSRAFIVGFVVPVGMALSGLLLILVPKHLVTSVLGWAGLALALVYWFLKSRKNSLYGDNISRLIQQQVFTVQDDIAWKPDFMDAQVIEQIEKLLKNTEDENQIRAYIDLLVKGAPGQAGRILLSAAPGFSHRLQDELLKMLATLQPKGWRHFAQACLAHGDEHLRSTALTVLTDMPDSPEWRMVEQWLKGSCGTRLKETAVCLGLARGSQALRLPAQQQLKLLLGSRSPLDQISGLAVVRTLKDRQWISHVLAAMQHADPRVRAQAAYALAALSMGADDTYPAQMQRAFTDASPQVRIAAMRGVGAFSASMEGVAMLAQGLRDEDFQVRNAVHEIVREYCLPPGENHEKWLEHYFDDFDAQGIMLKLLSRLPKHEKDPLLRYLLAQHLNRAEEKKRLELGLGSLIKNTPSPAIDHMCFIHEVLREDISRHLDLALAALENLDEKKAVSAIKAALAVGNRQLRALALETLRHDENDGLVHQLLSFLEATHTQNWEGLVENSATLTWAACLEKCSAFGGQWLKQCAEQLKTSVQATEFTENTEKSVGCPHLSVPPSG